MTVQLKRVLCNVILAGAMLAGLAASQARADDVLAGLAMPGSPAAMAGGENGDATATPGDDEMQDERRWRRWRRWYYYRYYYYYPCYNCYTPCTTCQTQTVVPATTTVEPPCTTCGGGVTVTPTGTTTVTPNPTPAPGPTPAPTPAPPAPPAPNIGGETRTAASLSHGTAMGGILLDNAVAGW